jgi:hypothetical protein
VNGTEADACFIRRQHSDAISLANFNDAKALIAQMKEWEIKIQEPLRSCQSFGIRRFVQV